MPTLNPLIKLNDNLSIGVQKGKGTTGVGYKNKKGEVNIIGNGVWQARFKFPLQRPKYKTTGIKYNPNDEGASERQATRVAYEMASLESNVASRGLDIHSPKYITYLKDEYLADIEKKTKENESLATPINMIDGGRSMWDKRKLNEAIAIWKNYLDEFIHSLPSRYRNQPSPLIQDIAPQDYDNIDSFTLTINNNLSIESRLKVITEMRHFLSWCYSKRYIDNVPKIKRPNRGGVRGARQRMRKEITPDMYLKIIDYTRKSYTTPQADKGERDYAYLFHLYILILANSGIRPPTNNIPHTRIRWEHVDLDEMIIHRLDEKGTTYDAIILPPAIDYWIALKNFYKKHQMKTTRGDVFAHPYTQYYRDNMAGRPKRIKIMKGSPIGSFKKRWETMAKHLFDQKRGSYKERVPQSERISFSSLRAWYITQRLYSDSNIRIEELARVVGSSISQIETRYFRLDMSKSYEHLSANAYDTKGKEPLYSEEGYYIGRTKKKRS